MTTNMRVGASLILGALVAILTSTCVGSGESVCIEDGTGGIHNVSDVPAGSCADSGKVCNPVGLSGLP